MSPKTLYRVEQEFDFLSNPDRTGTLTTGQLADMLYRFCVDKYGIHAAARKEIGVTPTHKRRYISDLLKMNASSFDARCQTLSACVLARI